MKLAAILALALLFVMAAAADDHGVHASFTADPLTGMAPCSVQFTDTSDMMGFGPQHWDWDFQNDGSVDSTERHPAFVYQAPGVYSVRHGAWEVLSMGVVIYDSTTGVDIIHVNAPEPAAMHACAAACLLQCMRYRRRTAARA